MILLYWIFRNHKQVLIVFFHPVFFPGVFFKNLWIGAELFKLLAGSIDLLLVPGPTFF